MTKDRSDPEELLQHIQEEEAKSNMGKLKIYLGAAPGVGKTYKMLHDAYLSRMKNLDVVVGIAESHGRQEIAKILSKFEVLAPQVIAYRDKNYLEFDIDAALKRSPGLILMDEMAHTNMSGLRHEKRWQDIKELLDRGIDVHTTLNVQHIESLKDDVAQIIQAPIKETVPDFMLERAHAIELVDLPVDDLLKRLQDGKIYIPEQADLAATHFFRKGNLIALRELALRVTASSVETDVRSYRKAEGIQPIWPTADKILVCVGPSRGSLKLIRTAKQLASGLQAEWTAVYIDQPNVFLSKNKRNRAIQNLRLAEQLGATTHVLVGRDIVNEILQFARESNVTQIMLSKDRTQSWRYFFRRRLADEIIAKSGEINIYIVGGNKSPEPFGLENVYPSVAWRFYGLSVVAVAAVTWSNIIFDSILNTNVIAMVYLLVVMMIALLGRPGPAFLTSILSVLAYDYYFVAPLHQIKIVSINSVVSLGMMLLVSLVISYLTVMKHREAKIARHIQQQTRASYDFSQKLLLTRGTQEILALSVEYIAQSLQAKIAVFMPKNNHLDVQAAYPVDFALNDKDRGVAQWVYDMAQPAGLGTDTLTSADALYLPLNAPSQPTIGVMRIQPQEKILFSPDQMHLLESLVNQLALALEIDRLQEKFRKKQLKIEIDSAKNSLLKTISTQLNYPLKFILGVMGSSISRKASSDHPGVNMTEELSKISLINNNILQIIEFETHHTHLEKQTIDLLDLVNDTLKQFRKSGPKRAIKIHCPLALPKLNVDQNRIQEVFLNLLDNSIKYSSPQSAIDIYLQVQLNHVLVSVENMGSLIEKEELAKIFNPFYRGDSPYHQDSLGLGLTLCQINIEAHGGTIWAENIHEKSVVAFRFTIPY